MHTCALLDTGRVWCWGINDWVSTGTGNNNRYTFPEPASGFEPSSPPEIGAAPDGISIAAGFNTTCIVSDGRPLSPRAPQWDGHGLVPRG